MINIKCKPSYNRTPKWNRMTDLAQLMKSASSNCNLRITGLFKKLSYTTVDFTITAISMITIFAAPKAVQVHWEASHLFVGW